MRLLSKELIAQQIKAKKVYLIAMTLVVLCLQIGSLLISARVITKALEGMINLHSIIEEIGGSLAVIQLIGLIYLAGMFSYLYSSEKIGEVHSLPFSKNQIYLNYIIVGFIVLSIPYVISAIGMIITQSFIINTQVIAISGVFKIAVTYILVSTIVFLLFSIIAIVCNSEGWRLGLSAIMLIIFEELMYGIELSLVANVIGDIDNILSFRMGDLNMITFGLIPVVISVITIVGLTIIGASIFNKRSLEKSGDRIVFK